MEFNNMSKRKIQNKKQSLVDCPECHELISSYAEFCPKCGYPLKKYDPFPRPHGFNHHENTQDNLILSKFIHNHGWSEEIFKGLNWILVSALITILIAEQFSFIFARIVQLGLGMIIFWHYLPFLMYSITFFSKKEATQFYEWTLIISFTIVTVGGIQGIILLTEQAIKFYLQAA
jgi:hypothetical protein